ncbi:hypothetical protein LCGC14_0677310 [marine sediment metagenome]|uniref:Uncharacterized protein n=1 Tax=marine sediment metagenome TaxID=412755 RepID=A0A0F9R9I0_9ZZZZ
MDLGKGIKDGGGYDLAEIKMAEETLGSLYEENKEEFQDAEPMHIVVRNGIEVARTEEFKARIIIIEYDAFNNIIGVELL